jgi:hypothetical protein
MRQRDPNWLKRIVEGVVRDVESKPYWLRNAKVDAELRRMAERRKAQEAAARSDEPSESSSV